MESKVVLPGDLLGLSSKFLPGSGTHIYDGKILATIPGTARTHKGQDAGGIRSQALETITVDLDTASKDLQPSTHTTPRLPTVGNLIYAKVVQLQRTQAIVQILALQSSYSQHITACAWPFRGILQSKDVRMVNKDRVIIATSVAVGDIIRAQVVSLGDQGGYYLSTAGDDLGVVMAWSQDGNVCLRLNWKEIVDEVTGIKEERKVAKPF